jgi:hypothetical protein
VCYVDLPSAYGSTQFGLRPPFRVRGGKGHGPWLWHPEQLEQSQAVLRWASGQPVEHFAYPYGIVDTKAFAHLRHAGYRTAFQLEAKKLDHHAAVHAPPLDRDIYLERRRPAVASHQTPAMIVSITLIRFARPSQR